MEPAQVQLARACPDLSQYHGTTNPSIHADRLSLAYMTPWDSFPTDAYDVFEQSGITHDVPLHDETEMYTVGNEIGLTARFVRNVCDPVIKALEPLLGTFEPSSGTAAIRFADFQALSSTEDTIPDVCLGLIATTPEPGNVRLVVEMKTPWTIPEGYLRLDLPLTAVRLEALIGQLVGQMRICSTRFGILSTYNSTVFVKREADMSFRLSSPIRHDATEPSLRQLVAGFAIMALSEPKYLEDGTFMARNLRGPPPLRISARLLENPARPPLASGPAQGEAVTPNSVIINTGVSGPTVLNCLRLLSDERTQHKTNWANVRVGNKATWAASMGGTNVILKCWGPENDELFETEAAVYQRISTQQSTRHRCLASWLSRGEIVCSSIFPSGHVLVLEQREGIRLDRLWHSLTETEHAYVQSECFAGIHALREAGLRLDDAGKHNILYDRENALVTLLDFEVAREVESRISAYYEMRLIFGSDLLLERSSGG